jgi:hypothetical protein
MTAMTPVATVVVVVAPALEGHLDLQHGVALGVHALGLARIAEVIVRANLALYSVM